MLKLGRFTLHELITSRFGLDGGAMFGVVPKAIWEKTNPADEKNRIDMVTRSFLIEDGKHLILIDTGMGDKWSDKHKSMYKLDTTTSNLSSELKRLGYTYADITHVILTHLHFDHTGGSVIEQNGVLLPAFPNATYYSIKAHWDWANNPTEKDRASFVKENFVPLQEAGQLKLLQHPDEFPLEGITGLLSDGHTKSMWLPKIQSEGRTFVYCADLLPTKSHIPVPFVMGYDNFPLTAMEEKKHFLSEAVKHQWILGFEHDKDTPACMVEQGEKRIQFKEAVEI